MAKSAADKKVKSSKKDAKVEEKAPKVEAPAKKVGPSPHLPPEIDVHHVHPKR